jgi:signal peptidase I
MENAMANSPEEVGPGAAPSEAVPMSEAPAAGQQLAAEPPEAAPPPETAPKVASEQAARPGETLLQSLLSIIVIVLFVITFVVQAFQIPSESMERTLLIGDYLLVDKIHFGQGNSSVLPYQSIRRGDIVVFHYPVDPSQHFVKRIIGIPGDRIRLHEKTVFINNEPIPDEYAVHIQGDFDPYRDNFPSERDLSGQVNSKWRFELRDHLQSGELVVPADRYFVMGDNRDRSLDSRYWGFVPRENIVGRPLVIYLSVRQGQDETAGSVDDKLLSSGRLLTHLWQFARWERIFHRVR